jgi:phosphomannomutase
MTTIRPQMSPPGSTLIATHSGLRGRPGAELTDALVERTVAGLLTLIRQRGLPATLGVARDERSTGTELVRDVTRIARARGFDVTDFGVVPTPALKLAARSRERGGAVMVTGSHLDPGLNGLKLIIGPGQVPVDVRELPDAAAPMPGAEGRVAEDSRAAGEHATAVCESVDAERVRASGLRVACSGGAGRSPELVLEALGCGAVEGPPDLELKLDADADRVQLINEKGAALDPELTFPLVMVAHDAWRVVKGADTSVMADALANAHGGHSRLVPPGELHLVQALLETGEELAGEGNGGVVVPSVGMARDGLAAGVAVIWLVARTGRPVSELAAELPKHEYARRRSTIPFDDAARPRAALELLAGRYGAGAPHSDTGVRIEREDGAWGMARMSATEPVLRITTEAPTEAEAEELHAQLLRALDAGAHAGESN